MSADKLDRDAPEPSAAEPASSSASEPPADPPAIKNILEIIDGPDDAPALPPTAEITGEGQLTPPTPTGVKPRERRTKLTPAQKRARRNAYLREKRARDKADRAARAALGIKDAPQSMPIENDASIKPSTVDAEARAKVGELVDGLKATGVIADAPPQIAPVDTEQLETLIGLTFHGISRFALPPKFGGGDLTAEERELLGKAWITPLLPYLNGPGTAWGVAALTTVQVFAMRALSHVPAEEQPRIESDETAAPPSKPAPPVEKPTTRATTRNAKSGERFNL